VASFRHFKGTGSVYVCRRNNKARAHISVAIWKCRHKISADTYTDIVYSVSTCLGAMCGTGRRRSGAGMAAVVMLLLVVVCEVSGTAATSTSSSDVSVTPTSQQPRDDDVVTPLSPTQCRVIALDPFQAERVRDRVKTDGLNLLEYKLVFPRSTANPLKHNMKHAFKVTSPTSVTSPTRIYLFHRRTRASYVYNGCLAWYNVVLTHGSTQA